MTLNTSNILHNDPFNFENRKITGVYANVIYLKV